MLKRGLLALGLLQVVLSINQTNRTVKQKVLLEDQTSSGSIATTQSGEIDVQRTGYETVVYGKTYGSNQSDENYTKEEQIHHQAGSTTAIRRNATTENRDRKPISSVPSRRDQGGRSVDNEIIGGRPVYPAEYPFAVHLFIENTQTSESTECGGSIINRQSILTACHCLATLEVHRRPRGLLSRYIWITAGIIKTNSNLDDSQIRKAQSNRNQVHPRCMRLVGNYVAFDLGVVHSAEHDPFQFYSHIRPMSIYSSNEFVVYQELKRIKDRRQVCSVVSWRFNKPFHTAQTANDEELRVAPMRIISDGSCSDFMCFNALRMKIVNDLLCPRNNTSPYPIICALGINQPEDCPASGGGILVCGNVVFGLTSWNPNCSSPNPTLFTGIQAALRWTRGVRTKVTEEKSGGRRLLATWTVLALFSRVKRISLFTSS